MNPNYRTLHNDIGMIQRSNNGWDLWFDNGDLVKAEDFHSLQVGIIIACLTSWNYMNRYGNPTYSVFGNRAYQLLKANKGGMVEYKIQQFFMECLKRMRRVYDVVNLKVKEVPYAPYTYFVEFKVISINNELVDGTFTISTDTGKSSSYIDYATYMPYASNENDLIIDLYLKNEYGGGLEGEVLYMYLKRGDGNYESRGVVGQTDENGYLRVTYNPWNDEDEDTRHSDDVNIIYFDYHGNTTYNPSTSKRTQFRTELFTYHIEFLENEIRTKEKYVDLKVKLTRESLVDHEIYPIGYTTVTIIDRMGGKIYDATTNANGEAIIKVEIFESGNFTTSYNDSSDMIGVSIIKQTPTIDFTPTKYELFVGDPFELRAMVTDNDDEPMENIEVIFKENDGVIGKVITDANGVAILSNPLTTDGSHDFTASIVGNNFYESVETSELTVVANKHETQLSLEMLTSSAIVGNNVEFKATVVEEVSENNFVGLYGLSVKFTDGNKVLGTVVTDNGVAVLSTNNLSVGEHTITAQVVETPNYSSSDDSIEIEVLDHDYSLDLRGAIIGMYHEVYTVQVSVALYDHGVLSDGVNFGDDSLIIESVETGDEWDMEESDSTKIFETTYSMANEISPVELTFNASWMGLTATKTFDIYPIINLHLDGSEDVTNLIQGYETTIENNKYGGAKQVGYLSDGFDNTRDWVVTMNYQRSKWDGGLSLFFNPYTSEDCQCGENNGWACIFKNGQEDILQWLDGYIKINKGSNLSNTGIRYTWVNNEICNVKIVKKASTITYYENDALKGSYSFSNLANSPKFYIGFMTWSERSTNIISDITVNYTNMNN